jgi:DNA-binding GntR family transcriptional regulator
MSQDDQAVLESGSGPYYRRLAEHLMDGIRAGRWPVGTSLPTEKELCDTFGLSRHTTREALRQLEDRQLIARRQGSGSTVVATSPPVRYEQNTQTIEDMLHHGKATRLHVLKAGELPGDANQYASQIAQLARSPCVWVRSIRYPRNDVRPLALVDVYVGVRSKAQARRLLDPDSAAQEIVNTVDVRKIDRIDQSFSALNVAEPEAKLLHVKPGDAVFQIVRNYHDPGGRLVVVAHSLYNGTLFTYGSTLRRS